MKVVWWKRFTWRNFTLSDPMDCSLPVSSVRGIFQARVLQWGAIAFSMNDAWYVGNIYCCCSVTQLCSALCDPKDCNMAGFPVHYQSWSLFKLMSTESVMPFNHLILCCLLLLLPSIFPSIRVFSNELTAADGQSIVALASATVLPTNIQSWFPLGLTSLILLSKGLLRVFSSTTLWKHQFFRAQSSLWFSSHICTSFTGGKGRRRGAVINLQQTPHNSLRLHLYIKNIQMNLNIQD